MIDNSNLFHSNRGTLRHPLSFEDKVKLLEHLYNFLQENVTGYAKPLKEKTDSPYLIFIPEAQILISRVPHLLTTQSHYNNTYINNHFSQFFHTMYQTQTAKGFLPIQTALLSRRVDHPLYKHPRYPYFQKGVQRPYPEKNAFEYCSSPSSSYNSNCVFSLTEKEARVFAHFLNPGFMQELEPIINLNDFKGL